MMVKKIILVCMLFGSLMGCGESSQIDEEDLEELRRKEADKLAQAKQAEVQGMPTTPPSQSSPGRTFCDRTSEIREVILEKLEKSDCSKVTAEDLRAIVILTLEDKNLTQLQLDDLAGLMSLEKLKLSNNGLASLPESVFSGLASLRWLFLSNNELTSLSSDVFSGLTSLRWLFLSNNDLTALPEGLFFSLSSLEEVYLGGNQLILLPTGLFLGVPSLSLKLIDLRDNQIPSEEKDRIKQGLKSGIEVLF